MNNKPILKYVRVEDNKIIIVPKGYEGVNIVKNKLASHANDLDFVEGLEPIGAQNIMCFIITLTSNVAYWNHHSYIKSRNVQELYFYTEKEEKIHIYLPVVAIQ